MNDRYLKLIGMLDFELLRAFVAVADCGGFHRAAERLNLTQSTVSQQMTHYSNPPEAGYGCGCNARRADQGGDTAGRAAF